MSHTTILFLFLVLLSIFSQPNKISPHLLDDFQKGKADFLILIKEPLNLKNVRDIAGNLIPEITDFVYKGRVIVAELIQHALVTQYEIQRMLREEKFNFTSLWINNIIWVHDGTQALAEKIAQREDVERLESNNLVDFDEPILVEHDEILPTKVQPNIDWIKCPQLWEKNITGEGIVLGISDTGVRHTHEILIDNYRGSLGNGTFDHNYNWYDPSKVFSSPVDLNGHGTHVMGIAAGSKGIGVAPGAKWIACRGFSTSGGILTCVQWLLAPTNLKGEDPNPDLRPHVTSHSYACFGCRLEKAIEALVEAGVVFIKSAGNSGPACKSITEPGQYPFVLTVGALGFQTDKIAHFSSRGPTKEGNLKPNIVSPGSDIVSASAFNPNGYVTMSGTSMAAPHLNGAIGLLWSAFPKLQRRIKETLEILYLSAKHQETAECGKEKKSPNNVYGYGTVNIYEAYKVAKKLGW